MTHDTIEIIRIIIPATVTSNTPMSRREWIRALNAALPTFFSKSAVPRVQCSRVDLIHMRSHICTVTVLPDLSNATIVLEQFMGILPRENEDSLDRISTGDLLDDLNEDLNQRFRVFRWNPVAWEKKLMNFTLAAATDLTCSMTLPEPGNPERLDDAGKDEQDGTDRGSR